MHAQANPLARPTDPASSHEAAKRKQRGNKGQHIRILCELLRWHPGKTSRELEKFVRASMAIPQEVKDRLNYQEIARRLPDAEKQGLVEKGVLRECRSGLAKGKVTTWYVTTAHRAELMRNRA